MNRQLKITNRGLARYCALAAVASLIALAAGADVPPEVQDRLQRLNGLVEDLLASQAVLQKRVATLNDELHAIREENLHAGEKLNDRFASREELRKLAEAIRELDRKREDDKRLILEEIKKLAQTPAVPAPREPSRLAPKDTPPTGLAKGYTYTIKPGDTLSAIAQAYARSGVKVTVDDITKANPNLNPNRLLPGQEVFIPDPNLK